MKSPGTTFLLLLSLLSIGIHANALTVEEYEQARNNKHKWQTTKIYLNGVGVGAALTAVALVQQGKSPPFCKPPEMELKPNNYIKLIDAFIKKNELPDTPVEAILLLSLVTAFPCS